MPTFTGDDDLRGAQFVDADLSGARFVRSELSGVVMRAVEVGGADIDAPWLVHGEGLLVNGVDVTPYVEAELNRRFPGREQRRATDPDGLRAAWAALEHTWSHTLDRVAAMPTGTVDMSVDGEWSFAQTLRHLVMATDPGSAGGSSRSSSPTTRSASRTPSTRPTASDMSVFSTPARRRTPRCSRSGRAASRWCVTSSPRSLRDELAATRGHPGDPDHPETVLSCLHVILEEEWEHHRYAVRDLDAIEAQSGG